jgi:hypothetical protein
MRITPLIVGGIVGALLLGGCAADEPIADPPVVETTATPTPTPTPTPEGPTPVDPAEYATILEFNGPGVDFDSPDHEINCGIWPEADFYADGSTEPVPALYAGCRAWQPTYETVPSSTPGGEIGCAGGRLRSTLPAGPVCGGGQEFVGEWPRDGSVGVIPVGSSLTYGGVTCTAPDENSIECVRELDGAGFTVSNSSYRYF